jgi:hypothetical protein
MMTSRPQGLQSWTYLQRNQKRKVQRHQKNRLTENKPNLSKSYETKKATMADNTVQTSESDKGKDIDPPPGGTLRPMPPSRNILAPKTPDNGGKADSSKEEEEDTLIERGSHQGLQVPTLTVGGR